MVQLGSHNCSCGKLDCSRIPCQHSHVVIAFDGADPFHYVSEWYKKETYLKAYQFPVNPVKGRSLWPISEDGPMLPPMVKKMPGRPAMRMRRKPLEGKDKGQTKLYRRGRLIKCRICHA